MNLDEIEIMALEADPFGMHGRLALMAASTPEVLGRFAALVIERCALECDMRVTAIDDGGNEYRREATASQCAAAIRKLTPNAE
jgi:hypothetical protein